MISSWMIYLLTRLSAINGLLFITSATSSITVVVILMCALDDGYSWEDIIGWKWYRGLAITAIISILSFVAVPSTKEAVAIWLVPKVVNNEDVQGSISKLPKFANKYLEEQLKEYTEGEEANGSSND